MLRELLKGTLRKTNMDPFKKKKKGRKKEKTCHPFPMCSRGVRRDGGGGHKGSAKEPGSCGPGEMHW